MAISFQDKIAYVNKFANKSDEKLQKVIKLSVNIESPKLNLTAAQKDKVKSSLTLAFDRIKKIEGSNKAVGKKLSKPNLLQLTKQIKDKEGITFEEARIKASKSFASAKKGQTGAIRSVLQDFKAKVGKVAYKQATIGTDIRRDIVRPALKAGKRKVTSQGSTTNAYGTFPNRVGKVYYESRANRMDVNQPSKRRYPKLADGGKTADVLTVKDTNGTWYLTYLDSTHFFLSDSKDVKGSPYHIGQLKSKPFYAEVDAWLLSHNKKANGGKVAYGDSLKKKKIEFKVGKKIQYEIGYLGGATLKYNAEMLSKDGDYFKVKITSGEVEGMTTEIKEWMIVKEFSDDGKVMYAKGGMSNSSSPKRQEHHSDMLDYYDSKISNEPTDEDGNVVYPTFDDEYYAKGGTTGIQEVEMKGYHRNIMGTISFDLKLKSMRKFGDFIVYPMQANQENKKLMIQSDTRIGLIEVATGSGVMSQAHPNGAYGIHLQMDKLTPFQLTKQQHEDLKNAIHETAGSKVGRSVVFSDNSEAANINTFGDGGTIATGDSVNVIAENKSGVVTNVISNGKNFSVKFVDGSKKVYDKAEVQKILSEEDYDDEFAKGGMTMQGIADKYEANEKDNSRSENMVLLAKHFGTPEDLKQAKSILKTHNKEGHLSAENEEKRNDLRSRLIPKAKAEMAKEGVKFAKGGKIKYSKKK